MRLAYLLICAAVVSLAQTGTGNIQGTVKDVADAVIPNAKVTLLHTATNRRYQ
jgi:hypothetical protein